MARYDIYIKKCQSGSQYDVNIKRQPVGRMLVYTLALRLRFEIMNELRIAVRMRKIIAQKKITGVVKANIHTDLSSTLAIIKSWLAGRVGLNVQGVLRKKSKVEAGNVIGLSSNKTDLKYRQYLIPQNMIGIDTEEPSGASTLKTVYENIDGGVGVSAEGVSVLAVYHLQADSCIGIGVESLECINIVKNYAENLIGTHCEADCMELKSFVTDNIIAMANSLSSTSKEVYESNLSAVAMGITTSRLDIDITQ